MDELQDLKDMVGVWLARRLPTPEMIREQIEKVRSVYPQVTDEQAKQVALEFEAVHGVTMDIGAALQEDNGFEQWLDNTKANPDTNFYFWERYRKLLIENGVSARSLSFVR